MRARRGQRLQSSQAVAPNIPIALLGFSLGTGIAAAILNRVDADRLVLCAGYSSFRKAARAAWIPGFLSPLVPPIWSAEDALRNCSLPILIVQGDHDRLFRLPMAHDLVASCNGHADLLILPARSHNEPFYHPQMHYWGPIVSWLLHAKDRLHPSDPLAFLPPPSRPTPETQNYEL